jgi:RNA-binding protein YhbY
MVKMMVPIPSTTTLRSSLDRVLGLRQGVREELQKAEDRVVILGQEGLTLNLVAELLRQFIDREVNIGVQAVQNLQTEGLQAVFDDQDLQVKAEVEVLRGKVSVSLRTIQKAPSGDLIEGDGMESLGGALTTLQSILLRIIIILRRGLRPFILLDESLPAVEGGYTINTGKFLSVLCEKLGMDILIVTFDPLLVETADRAYRISKKNGVASFHLIGDGNTCVAKAKSDIS